MPLGTDFKQEARKRVSESTVLLALIGRNWSVVTDEAGTKRLDDPDDLVRVEIETALQQNITVIPVLVDGARLPQASDLPSSLRPLIDLNALELSYVGFRSEAARLVAAVDQTLSRRATGRDTKQPTDKQFAEQRKELDRALAEQREQLDRTLAEQSMQLDRTLAEQRARTLNERFASAAGQLGSDKPAAVQLAGVYAMAGLADDWVEKRQTCVDVLCAYLRMPYEPDPGEEAPEPERLSFRASREVRHIIIRVIAAHLRDDAAVSWQGLNFDFTGVVFDGGDFSGTVFSGGQVGFRGATFSGSPVDFSDAKFSGQVDFSGAKFSAGVDFGDVGFSGETRFDSAAFSGKVIFDRATFSDGTATFAGAKFPGEAYFRGTVFTGTVIFNGAVFSSSVVTFMAAKFSGQAYFRDTLFTRAVNFGGAEFSGREVSFNRIRFLPDQPSSHDAKFSGYLVSFHDAKFSGHKVEFYNATFGDATLGVTVDFSSAQFTGKEVAFDDATFSRGAVIFAHAKFAAGETRFLRTVFSSEVDVNFDSAEFSGGEVSFNRTKFPSGQVDFSLTAVWTHPPEFDWKGTPPSGVKLPAQPGASGEAGSSLPAGS
jgi:uncharacterized protein YjbI with pentapeptide repeats